MKSAYNFPALYFEATRRCSLSCPSCMTGCNDPDFVRNRYEQELTYHEAINLVLVPAKELGVRQVGFSGGEFLMRKDAVNLVRVAAELGYEVKIVTNGVLLNDKLLEELKSAARDRLVISFGINSIINKETNRDT